MKKFLILITILFLFTANIFAAENVTGEKTFQSVLLNGENVEIGSYLINERNYLKLRDVAALLVGTSSQFNVDWDEDTGNVIIETGKPYVKLGTDLIPFANGKVSGVKGNINLLLNGELKQIETVLIKENNYLQLRQLGEVVGFGVDWDEKTSAILISTDNKKEVVTEQNNQSTNYIELSKNAISENEKNYEYTKSISVGEIIPKFYVDMIDESSKNIHIGKILKDDKVQLFNFFKTDCKFCLEEMSDFDKFNNENIDIIMVALDNNSSEVRKIFDNGNYKLPVFKAVNTNNVIKDFSLKVVPTSVFGKNGMVIGIFEGRLNEKQLKFVLNEINSGKSFPSKEIIANNR